MPVSKLAVKYGMVKARGASFTFFSRFSLFLPAVGFVEERNRVRCAVA